MFAQPGTGKMALKKRLDELLVAAGLAESKELAQRLIMAGEVRVAGQVATKPGHKHLSDVSVTVSARPRFVSRGGDKLEGAFAAFPEFDVRGKVCLDVGASTGGFTDCLLQFGATRVYSIDVGYGLLDWKLRQDPRVVVLERTNARHLSATHIPEPLDLAVIDASFISLAPLFPPLLPLFRAAVRILALVKPQFQLPRENIGPGGIVSDAALHDQALAMVRGFGAQHDLTCAGVVASPIRGAKGNQEFLMLLTGPAPAAQQ